MKTKIKRIKYSDLNSRQQENYNFQKVSAILADYGFMSIRLTDDWQGADFIAQHVDGETFLRVQLKGRLTFCRKYLGKALYIAFHDDGNWYLFPHDVIFNKIKQTSNITESRSWKEGGIYSFPRLTQGAKVLLNAYRIGIDPTLNLR